MNFGFIAIEDVKIVITSITRCTQLIKIFTVLVTIRAENPLTLEVPSCATNLVKKTILDAEDHLVRHRTAPFYVLLLDTVGHTEFPEIAIRQVIQVGAVQTSVNSGWAAGLFFRGVLILENVHPFFVRFIIEGTSFTFGLDSVLDFLIPILNHTIGVILISFISLLIGERVGGIHAIFSLFVLTNFMGTQNSTWDLNARDKSDEVKVDKERRGETVIVQL